jgi:deferrochelatase/peroxidase EfeB
MTTHEADFADVQGLVRFGYGKMKEASYALLRVRDAAAARAWLRAAPITTAVAMDPPPTCALQVAFTADGLRAIGVADSVVAGFSPEFLDGMTEESRARRLGDLQHNAPDKWWWGNGKLMPHLLVMFFSEPGGLVTLIERVRDENWQQAFEEPPRWLNTENLDGIEPFGFADGISQPQIDWERRRNPTEPQIDFTNIAAPGEFLLGYPNEYNKYTDRPLVDADERSAGLLPAEDVAAKKDVGRNGTYLVMRQLEQDVRSFWQFLHNVSGGDAIEAEKLGAAMVGRTRSGDPLVPIQKDPIPGIGPKPDELRQNNFTFAENAEGARCPFGAHVHRANPRNTDFPGRPTGLKKILTMLGFGPKGFRDDLMSPVRFHRILRRGREYGPELLPENALSPAPANDPKRGLHFICLNANISRQFEFLQNAWVVNTKFSALTGESDPLLGTREPVRGCPVIDNFTRPREGNLRQRVEGLPAFVTVRGGAYFFLPSIRAVRYFAGDKNAGV